MPTRGQRIRIHRSRVQRTRELAVVMHGHSLIEAANAHIAHQDATREAARPKPRRTPDTLALLVSRHTISPAQAQAAERWHRDWTAAGAEPRVISTYGPRSAPSSGDTSIQGIAARARFEAATLAISALGPEAIGVATHVALMPRAALLDYQEAWRWPAHRRRELSDTLRQALEALRQHYAQKGRA